MLQPVQRDQCQLAILKGVGGIALGKAFGVKQGYLQIEAPAHFHQPLVLQGFRNEDQYATGAPVEQLAVDHQVIRG